jgi:hypothetical protein
MRYFPRRWRSSSFRLAAGFSRPQRAWVSTPSIKVPGPSTTTWERSAARVKNSDNSSINNGVYLEAIRETHDPSRHVKTIEDELKATIGQALGRQGHKILTAVQGMADALADYEDLLQHEHERSDDDVQACVVRYNERRREAIQARWELIVHRQAAGFIVSNHKYVMDNYPIAEALSADSTKQADTKNKKEEPPRKVFGDQLDWWQRIGRWR